MKIHRISDAHEELQVGWYVTEAIRVLPKLNIFFSIELYLIFFLLSLRLELELEFITLLRLKKKVNGELEEKE